MQNNNDIHKKNAFKFCKICYTCVHFIVKLPYRGPYTCLISVNFIICSHALIQECCHGWGGVQAQLKIQERSSIFRGGSYFLGGVQLHIPIGTYRICDCPGGPDALFTPSGSVHDSLPTIFRFTELQTNWFNVCPVYFYTINRWAFSTRQYGRCYAISPIHVSSCST